MTEPYYQDDRVTLYHGDCREVTEWLAADVLVTDPPYGRSWKQGGGLRGNATRSANGAKSRAHGGIANDSDTSVRDAALSAWGATRPAVAFGDLMLTPPEGVRMVLVYRKPGDAGVRGAVARRRRDLEAVYLLGTWPTGIGGASSLIATSTPCVGSQYGPSGRFGHPHAKPTDVMAELIGLHDGIIADPVAGSGSTLVAAKQLGRHAIGVELEERYCEVIAKRLAQDVLDFGEGSAEFVRCSCAPGLCYAECTTASEAVR